MHATALDYDEAIERLEAEFTDHRVDVIVWRADGALESGFAGVLRHIATHDHGTGARQLDMSGGTLVLHPDTFASAAWEADPDGPVPRALRVVLEDGREIEIAEP